MVAESCAWGMSDDHYDLARRSATHCFNFFFEIDVNMSYVKYFWNLFFQELAEVFQIVLIFGLKIHYEF